MLEVDGNPGECIKNAHEVVHVDEEVLYDYAKQLKDDKKHWHSIFIALTSQRKWKDSTYIRACVKGIWFIYVYLSSWNLNCKTLQTS